MRRCPNCGLEITDPGATVCPRCSYQLAEYPGQPPAGGYGWPAPSSQQFGMDPATQPGSPGQGQYGPYGAPPSSPLPGQPGASAPSAGGWAQPPQGYGPPTYSYPPYGQAAPPSSPLPPGQGYPPGYPPGYAPVPPRPAQPNRTPVLIGALVAVLVLAVAGAGLYLARGNGSTGPSANTTPTSGATVGPTVTPTPSEVTAYSSSLVASAPNWPNDTHCAPKSDGYHVQAGYICYAPVDSLTDARVTVRAKQISGTADEPYGIVIRRASEGNYYIFAIDSGGHWAFASCTSSSPNCTLVQDFTASSAIHTGLNVFNTLSVDARGTHFDFFVNGTKVGQTDDSTYSSGLVGLSGIQSGVVVYRDITIAKPRS